MGRSVLVTGATGNVGRHVARQLVDRGATVRVAGSPAKVAPDLRAHVAVTRLDFTDSRTFGPAVEGCRSVFLLRPPSVSRTKTTLVPFIDAGIRAGVESFVFLSVAGAERNRLVPHRAVEDHLLKSRTSWTLLRPGFFSQNFEDAYYRDIVEDGRVYVPAGAGRVAFVDVRDVAEVAARVIVGELAGRAAYTLTGPEAIRFDEAVSLLARAVGRSVRYEPASVIGYARHLRARGLPVPCTANPTERQNVPLSAKRDRVASKWSGTPQRGASSSGVARCVAQGLANALECLGQRSPDELRLEP